MPEFQSLFWWIEGWDTEEKRSMKKVAKFQSLFWWIEGWDSVYTWLSFLFITGFNPCSGGLRAGTRLNTGETERVTGFQSLFWWIEGWD